MPIVPTYDILNCGPNHRFVANGKIVHNSIYNLQNLPKQSRIRNTLIAPPGHTLIIADSASIEARVLAWFAEQEDLLEIFREKGDPYRQMASIIYGIPIDEVTKPLRNVGKQAVLGCGYGMGATKFQATAAKAGITLSNEESERIIQIYRGTNNKIRQLWYYLNDRISDIATGPINNGFITTNTTYKGISFEKDRVVLPNNLYIKYPNLRHNDLGDWIYKEGRKLYGGALCLAGDTLVLTQRGPIPLLEISKKDRVFDGISWVTHGGVVYKGLKQTIDFGTIRMTPDHKVWTKTGWRPANDVSFDAARQAFFSQSKKPIRAILWDTISNYLRRIKQEKDLMGSALYRLWYNKNLEFLRPTPSQILWLYSGEQRNPQNGHHATICHLPQHGSPLQKPKTPRLEKLRRAWNFCSQRLELFRDLLDGYGTNLSTGTRIGPNKQQRKLLERKLPLDNLSRKLEQQKKHSIRRNPDRSHTTSHSSRKIQNRLFNPTLPTNERSTRQHTTITTQRTEPVYDLLDCGPHHRFTVVNHAGDKILVHNCENIIQALARIVISEQALRAHREVAPVVLLVHDEIVCVTPIQGAETKLNQILEIMRTPPTWASDLPLDAEGETSLFYKK